jgi:hypothetical protein
MALRELQHLLQEHSSIVHELVFAHSADSASPLLAELVGVLLDVTRRSSSAPPGVRLRLLAATCLGQIGAVEPARMPGLAVTLAAARSEGNRGRASDAELEDRHLIVELIRHFLVKALRGAPDTSVQDKFAYAIQELLRCYGRSAGVIQTEPEAQSHSKAVVMPAIGSGPAHRSDPTAAATAATTPARETDTTATPPPIPSTYISYSADDSTTGAQPLPRALEEAIKADITKLDAVAAEVATAAGADSEGGTVIVDSAGGTGDAVRELLDVLTPYWSSKLTIRAPSHAESGRSAVYSPFFLRELRSGRSQAETAAHTESSTIVIGIGRAPSRAGAASAVPFADRKSTAALPSSSPVSGLSSGSQPRSGQPGTPFERWVAAWSRHLIERLTASKAPRFASLWPACRAVVQADVTTALFILPYLVRDALTCCPWSEAQTVVTEIRAVLKFGGETPGTEATAAASAPGLADDRLDDTTAASASGTSSLSASNFHHRATQAIFSLLDTLKRWDMVANSKEKKSPYVPEYQSFVRKAVEDAQRDPRAPAKLPIFWLLDTIPLSLLAHAARKVHAFARALMYKEADLRQRKGGVHGSGRVGLNVDGTVDGPPVGTQVGVVEVEFISLPLVSLLAAIWARAVLAQRAGVPASGVRGAG